MSNTYSLEKYEIENFYNVGDGDDWLPAISRAQDQWHASLPATDPNR